MKKPLRRQRSFLQVGLVGALGACIQALLLVFLVEFFHLYPVFANVIAGEAAIVSNFIFNNFWTFKRQSAHALPKRFFMFNASALGSIAIQAGVVWTGIYVLGMRGYVLYAALGICIGWVGNYFIYSRFIWKTRTLSPTGRSRLYYIANARMPSEKAHGIQIAKMCEAFIEAGIDLALVVPRRGKSREPIREFYGLRVDIPVIKLPAIDLYNGGRILYRLSSLSFIISYFLYILFCIDRRSSVIYTVDLDHFSYGALPLLGVEFFSEMHGGKPDTSLHRRLFSVAKGIIPTNNITKKQLQELFGLPNDRFVVEPNGVDLSKFSFVRSRQAARRELGLPEDMRLALYIGRFFGWKGLEILPEAASSLSHGTTLGIVGGTAQELEKVIGQRDLGRITFYGDQPYARVPLWAAAADVLVVLGTKRDEQSYNYTSPMKIFEYMAMRRPIVASRTPALLDILGEQAAFFYEPDNGQDLAHTIERAIASGDAAIRADAAYHLVEEHTWAARAERIRAHMNRLLQGKVV